MTNIYAEAAAREFAIKAHGDQRYGRMPYSYHLDQVAYKLRELEDYGWCVPEEAYVVAYLHDVLEDTLTGDDEVEEQFGSQITRAIVYLSKNYWPSYESYMTHVKENKISHVVKIADTMCNLQASIASVEPKRIKKYSEQLARLMEN